MIRFTTLLLITFLTGCSSVSLVLRTPVSNQCEATGLKGCPELTEGVLLYVEGDTQNGRKKLLEAASANAPQEVAKFAASLRTLGELPGVGEYMKPVMEVIAILSEGAVNSTTPPVSEQHSALADGAAVSVVVKGQLYEGAVVRHAVPLHGAAVGQASLQYLIEFADGRKEWTAAKYVFVRRPSAAPATRPQITESAFTAETDDARLTTGTIFFEDSIEDAKPCGKFGKKGSRCVLGPVGPFVLTDLFTENECKVFAVSRSGNSISWRVFTPPSRSGMRLVVSSGSRLILGVEKSLSACVITWSGFKPYPRTQNPYIR
jgi:hypothetical protein